MTTPYNTVAAGAGSVPSSSSFQPYQFRPESIGSFKGYATFVSDATVAGGALTTVNSASGGFANAQPGMVVTLEGGGSTFAGSGTASSLRTTIAAVNSANQIVLNAASVGALTNRTLAYGWDSTAAVNASVAAAALYAAGHNYYFELVASAFYMLDGPLIQGGTSKTNSQVPFPVVGIAGNPAMTMAIVGTRNNGGPIMFQGSGDTPAAGYNGFGFVSTLTGQVYNGTFGQPAVFGGPTPEQGYTGAFTNLWNNLVLVVDGITVLVQPIASVSGIDATSCTQAEFKNVRALAMAPAQTLGGALYNPVWSGAQSFPKGLVTPQGGNNARSSIGYATVYGFATGIETYEQLEFIDIATIFCGTGIVANGSNGGHNSITGFKWSAEANNTHLLLVNTAQTGINILSMQAENASQYTAGVMINDASNVAHGRIGINSSLNTASITITGGANLEVIGDYTSTGISRGLQTPPTVPATTVALPNPFVKHCTVLVTGSTITAITVTHNGTISYPVPGSGQSVVRVPQGASITLTYPSGTPSWVWQAD